MLEILPLFWENSLPNFVKKPLIFDREFSIFNPEFLLKLEVGTFFALGFI